MSRLLLIVPVLGVLACTWAPADPPTNPDSRLTIAQAGNATYRGLVGVDHPITLTDGRWEGEPYQPGAASRPGVVLADVLLAVGDVGNDGLDDAVVLLGVRGAGTGDLVHLAVVTSGKPGTLGTAVLLLGDRVQVRHAEIEQGRVVADLLRAGSGDAACCPGELVRVTIDRDPAGALRLESSLAAGRLSLGSLEPGEWVLERWTQDDPVAEPRPPTLAHVGGAFEGFGGCNRYSAAVASGEFPGSVRVGAVATTAMACPEPEELVEARFLAALQGATRFGWQAGRLWISYQAAGGLRAMSFRRVTGS